MKTITIFPLVFSFVAWVLTLCGLLGGKSGMFGNHVVSLNTSHLGRDLLNNSNLFNLDNSTILYTLLFTENDTAVTPIVINQPGVNRNTINASGSSLARQLSGLQQSPANTSGTLMSIVQPIYDFIADELRLNKTGFFYQTGYLILNNTSEKLGSETDRFLQRVRVIVPTAAITALQAQLLRLAQSYSIPSSDLARRSPASEADSWQSDGLLDVSGGQDYTIKSPQLINQAQVEHIRATLLKDVSQAGPGPGNSTLGQALISGDFSSYLDGMLRGAASDLNGTLQALANDLDNPNSNSVPARMLRESRPYLASALRQYANTQINAVVGYAKTGFRIHDFYSIYMTQFCYGDELPNGKQHYVACQNINDLRGANLAPRIRSTLRAAGSNRRVPDKVELGPGPESSIDGLVKITKLLFAIDTMGVITSGAAFFSTLFSMVAPHGFEAKVDGLCMLMHLFAYTTLVIVFALSLLLVLACKLVLGGVLSSVSIINVAGWGFAVINIMAVLMITIAFDFWIYIWMRNMKARAARDALDQARSPEESSSEKGLMTGRAPT